MSAPAPAERPALPRKSTHPTLVVEEDTEMHAEGDHVLGRARVTLRTRVLSKEF